MNMNGPDALAAVLVLDEAGALFPRLESRLQGRFRVIAAGSPEQALAVARERRVHVLVINPREHDGTGAVTTVRAIRSISPGTLVVVLAGAAERAALLALADEGDIFRVAQKPCDLEQVQGFIALAADQSRAFFTVAQPVDRRREHPCVLVLDEDTATAVRVREALRLTPGDRHTVHWCDTLYEAFDALANRPVGLLVSDLRLDGEEITGGLRTLRGCHPEVSTLIHTSVKDTSGLTELVSGGCLLVPKPASRERLAGALAAAMNPLASMLLESSRAMAPARKGVFARGLMEMLGRRPELASDR